MITRRVCSQKKGAAPKAADDLQSIRTNTALVTGSIQVARGILGDWVSP